MNENNTTGNKEVIRHLKEAESLYILVSGCTREPYVLCDPETFDDETYMFFDLEDARAKADELREGKIPVQAANLEGGQMLMFYTGLNSMGVNALLVREGEEEWRIQLSDFVRRDKPSPDTDTYLWVENPELHLAALYYMQELRREEGKDNPHMGEWQDEISNYFSKGSYIVPMQKEGTGIPVIKLNDGHVYQAIFTDIIQYGKFNREKELRPVVVTADKIPQILVAEASGVLVNPMGIRMPLEVKKPEDQPEDREIKEPEAQEAPEVQEAPEASED